MADEDDKQRRDPLSSHSRPRVGSGGPGEAFRGRGATINPPGRFERTVVEPFEDGWDDLTRRSDRVVTAPHPDASRSAITRNDSPDVPFDRSVNPYRGCEHGCSYCFARPSHAFLGLSAGLDFETRIFYKPRGPELLRRELARPSYRPEVIAIGANTDPYQPLEREQRLTRRLIEVLWEHRHPLSIITKSQFVLRDLDILAPMAEAGLASVCVSLTTLDPDLARRMEPRASAPQRRLQTIHRLTQAGVPVSVLTSPMIPALNDGEVESLLQSARHAGADSAGYALLRLPHELEPLFSAWLAHHYPERSKRVLALLRQCHGGQIYRAQFERRMRGDGPYARMLQQRFDRALARLGLRPSERRALDVTQFRRPGEAIQLALLHDEPSSPG